MKPTYAPVPARAMKDGQLTEHHLRTLMVIAAHDRLGKNGIGCWASHERLASMVGCAYNRLSMNIRHLAELGYIERVQHPLNKRLRVYRVIYTEDDAATMKVIKKSVQESSPDSEEYPSRDGEVLTDDSSPSGEGDGHDSSPTHGELPNENKVDSLVNIFSETGNRLGINLKRDSAEAAPLESGDRCQEEKKELSVGEKLARFERLWEAGHQDLDIDTWREYFDHVIETHDMGSPEYGRAYRLLQETYPEDCE